MSGMGAELASSSSNVYVVDVSVQEEVHFVDEHNCVLFLFYFETEASWQYVAGTTTLPVPDRLTWCNTRSPGFWKTDSSLSKQGKSKHC